MDIIILKGDVACGRWTLKNQAICKKYDCDCAVPLETITDIVVEWRINRKVYIKGTLASGRVFYAKMRDLTYDALRRRWGSIKLGVQDVIQPRPLQKTQCKGRWVMIACFALILGVGMWQKANASDPLRSGAYSGSEVAAEVCKSEIENLREIRDVHGVQVLGGRVRDYYVRVMYQERKNERWSESMATCMVTKDFKVRDVRIDGRVVF